MDSPRPLPFRGTSITTDVPLFSFYKVYDVSCSLGCLYKYNNLEFLTSLVRSRVSPSTRHDLSNLNQNVFSSSDPVRPHWALSPESICPVVSVVTEKTGLPDTRRERWETTRRSRCERRTNTGVVRSRRTSVPSSTPSRSRLES